MSLLLQSHKPIYIIPLHNDTCGLYGFTSLMNPNATLNNVVREMIPLVTEMLHGCRLYHGKPKHLIGLVTFQIDLIKKILRCLRQTNKNWVPCESHLVSSISIWKDVLLGMLLMKS